MDNPERHWQHSAYKRKIKDLQSKQQQKTQKTKRMKSTDPTKNPGIKSFCFSWDSWRVFHKANSGKKMGKNNEPDRENTNKRENVIKWQSKNITLSEQFQLPVKRSMFLTRIYTWPLSFLACYSSLHAYIHDR